MSGVVYLDDDHSWVVSAGTYDHVIARLESELTGETNRRLSDKLHEAAAPRLRFLSLEDLDANSLGTFRDAVRRIYERIRADGAKNYGGAPEVFDAVLNNVRDLTRVLDVQK
jgi:hypothetical protein